MINNRVLQRTASSMPVDVMNNKVLQRTASSNAVEVISDRVLTTSSVVMDRVRLRSL